MLDQRLFRRLRKSDETALRELCHADTRWGRYYRDHQVWVERAIKDLSGTGRAAFGCFSASAGESGEFSTRLDACIFLKLSEYDNSAELKNLVLREEGDHDGLPESSETAAIRLIEKTARYCETREVGKLEIELPQSEHTFISLFLRQSFRVAALRERYYPGQSVCILEKKIGDIYYADPFEYVQLGKWLLRAILPCKIHRQAPFQFKEEDGVPYLPFEIHPTHPAFSKGNAAGYKRRLKGWMVILDEPDLCTEAKIRQIADSPLREDGQLHFVLAHSLHGDMQSLLKDKGVNCFQFEEVRAIAGGDRSSLSIPMERSDVGGILTVLEKERIDEYCKFKDKEFVYYLLGGIGGAIPRFEGAGSLLAVYCPNWSDGKSGIIAIADIHEITPRSFDQAFNRYDDVPKALTDEDLAYYRIRSDHDGFNALLCSKLQLLPKRLDFENPLWAGQENMREYIRRELEATNSAYINSRTCDALRQSVQSPQHVGKSQPDPKRTRTRPPSAPRRSDSMRILFLAANPQTTQSLDLEEEQRALERELEAVKFRKEIKLFAHLAVRPDDLVKYVREHNPNVIHFSGHGSKNGIVFRNDKGNYQAVDGKSLRRFLEGRGISLIVLNACYTDTQAQEIIGAVKTVIGTTDAVDDDDARRFTVAFYRSLGNGFTVDDAFRDGCDAVTLHGGPERFRKSGILDLAFVSGAKGKSAE